MGEAESLEKRIDLLEARKPRVSDNYGLLGIVAAMTVVVGGAAGFTAGAGAGSYFSPGMPSRSRTPRTSTSMRIGRGC